MAINVSTNNYYIYTVTPVSGRIVSGVVLCNNLLLNKNITVVQHELTSYEKVEDIREMILSSGMQKSPIVLGYHNNTYLDRIINMASKTLIQSYEHGKVTHSIFSVDKETQEMLQKILSRRNTFYVLDGHHRYNALQSEGALTNEIMAWIVPIHKMQVKTFVKCLNFTDPNEFDKHVVFDSESCVMASQDYDFSVYYNNQVYKIKTTYHGSTFEVADQFLNMLVTNGVISNVSYCKYSNITDIISIIRNDQVKFNALIIPRNISSAVIKNVFATKQTMPIHSTCFLPKPLEGMFNYKIPNNSCIIN